MSQLIILLTSVLGVISTYFVSHQLRQGPVRASAGLSLIVALTVFWLDDQLPAELARPIPYVFFGASFIGMVSAEVLGNYVILAISGVVFASIYLNTSQVFAGYGGALGTSACIALLVSLSLSAFYKKWKSAIRKKGNQPKPD